MGLAEYRRRRRFDRTSEPAPDEGAPAAAGRRRFVVQLHHARRRHYDLRLQVGDALKSWAVPKGPSFDPDVRRLAVEVEDHPLEYAEFEGDIPEGEYGAGHVAIFDAGIWTTERDVGRQLGRGELAFELFGERLRGKWHLVRTAERDWLLFKARDAHAGPFECDDWLKGEPPESARRAGPRWAERAAALPGARREALPPLPPSPQLATSAHRPPEGAEWIHEIKWDGYRLLGTVDRGGARLWSRNGHDWTARLPELREALDALGVETAAFDGELVACGGKREDFATLQAILSGEVQGTTRYVLFDLLHIDGVDLTGAPLLERRALLSELLRDAPTRLALSTHIQSAGGRAFSLAVESGFEGIVSKRGDRPHHEGRSDEWRKIKRRESDEFAVVGVIPSRGVTGGIGALLLAEPDASGGFRYVGRVGSGLSDRARRELTRELGDEGGPTPTVPSAPARLPPGARWFAPRLVVEVWYRGRSKGGLLRHASFKALRPDKDVEDLMTESRHHEASAKLTSADKLLFPESGVTKGEVAAYYESAMELLLPEILNRPLSVVRCPGGIAEGCFFQKHRGAGMERVGVARLGRSGDDLLVVRDPAGLMELVQFNAIELHPWGSRADDPGRCDRLVFDLDPGPDVPFVEVISAARRMRDLLGLSGLTSFVRTTGGKGLHVVVPLSPPSPWERATAFSRAFADGLARLEPARFVATSEKRARSGKIYVDYLRNVRGATAVASFSLRAREGAPVAMPLRWSELGRAESGAAYPIRRARARIAHLRSHPWEGIDALEQGLDEALERLSDQLSSA